MPTARAFSLAAVLCLGLLLPACKQGEGDRCEVDNDCEAPLKCENVTETKTQGPSGRCGTGATPTPTADAAVDANRQEAAAPDAARDATAPDVAPDVLSMPPMGQDAAPDQAGDAPPPRLDGPPAG
jgi:hypothetical protein